MRYLVLVSAVLMQMCLGATYSWSVYVEPLRSLAGLQQGSVQLPFTTFYFVFPLTMMIMGSLLVRVGTRRSAMVGGLCFGGGWLLASLGKNSFVFTVLGIGVLSGIGAGMAYIVPIAVCIRWFPRSKGLVTGVAVAGFGGGAALVSQLAGWLMSGHGLTPFQTFAIFGLCFSTVVCCAGAFMRLPDNEQLTAGSTSLRLREVAAESNFRILYLAMAIALAAGFAINANLKQLFGGQEDAVRIGVTAVSLFALANGAGRIVWGAIFDRTAAATAIQQNLFLQALVLFGAPFLLATPFGFLSLAVLTGFNYGGVLVLYVSTASRRWGPERVGQVYGWLFSSNIPASVAPMIAGYIFDATGDFTLALYGLALLLVGCGLYVRRRSSLLNQAQEPQPV